jgi:hypothetical protein
LSCLLSATIFYGRIGLTRREKSRFTSLFPAGWFSPQTFALAFSPILPKSWFPIFPVKPESGSGVFNSERWHFAHTQRFAESKKFYREFKPSLLFPGKPGKRRLG